LKEAERIREKAVASLTGEFPDCAQLLNNVGNPLPWPSDRVVILTCQLHTASQTQEVANYPDRGQRAQTSNQQEIERKIYADFRSNHRSDDALESGH
jgi:hypothetical protein